MTGRQLLLLGIARRHIGSELREFRGTWHGAFYGRGRTCVCQGGEGAALLWVARIGQKL